ncbi:MAG: SDR family NAD(P)-dependent oxidoreductase, partial [bacterium]
MDLAPAGAGQRLAAAVADLDVGLVVLAAGFGTSGPFVDAPLGPELEMIDLNCRSVAELCHALGPRLLARGRGGLVLLSSLVAFQGVPRAANYAATKAWVQAFAEGLRGEGGPRGVDVLAVAPGRVRGGFAARA